MIFYCAPASLLHHSIQEFLASWGRELEASIHPLSYARLFESDRLQSGTYILTHFEALTPDQLRLVLRLHRRLKARPRSFRVLNDPSRFLDRPALLDLLFRRGINPFRAARLDAPLEHLKYPVFLRLADEHFSFDFKLLHNRRELDEHGRLLLDSSPGLRPHDLLAVEYCDVSDGEDRFRKYSAMRIGERIIPRHVLASHHWMTKYPDLVDDRTVREEQDFVFHFPHEALLRPIFDLAGLEYGRMDYAFQGGQLRVWEINSNPVVVPAAGRTDPRRAPSQERSAAWILDAFRDLDRQPLAPSEIRAWGWLDRGRLSRAVKHSRHDRDRRRALVAWVSTHQQAGHEPPDE